MRLHEIRTELRPDVIGPDLHRFVTELYPICRSITGNGVRETLRGVRGRIPLQIHEVPTGTQVLDWTVPKEWNINDAYITDSSGRRIVDFKTSNLHVLNYSVPYRGRLQFAELRPHLFTLPEQPNSIPYRTSYYNDNWGFCLAHDQLAGFNVDEDYEVVIDAELCDGHLTYGELLLHGSSSDEVLVSCHICHPSLCNDNLSGIAVATALAQALGRAERRLTYRFVFVPGTIGSISWLSLNPSAPKTVKHGLVLSGVGDRGAPTYKYSRRGDATIDRAMVHVLAQDGRAYATRKFSPWGYDERQYCSPGFDLPVGALMRTPHGEYPEYHTSDDNLEFVAPDSLADTVDRCLAAFDVLERDAVHTNLSPFGEPQLGRRGIYGAIGGSSDKRTDELALLWVLNLSDGTHSLLDIAERSGLSFDVICRAAELLVEHGLLSRP